MEYNEISYGSTELLHGKYTKDNVEVEYVIVALSSKYILFDLAKEKGITILITDL